MNDKSIAYAIPTLEEVINHQKSMYEGVKSGQITEEQTAEWGTATLKALDAATTREEVYEVRVNLSALKHYLISHYGFKE